MNEETYEFASAAWFETLRRNIVRLVGAAGPEMDGVRWTVCEVFTDVPRHLAQGPDGKAAWHCRIRGREIDFGLGEIPGSECDFKVTADYTAILPFAKVVLAGDPAVLEKVNADLLKAAMEGKVVLEGNRETRPEALATLHDDMVRVTR